MFSNTVFRVGIAVVCLFAFRSVFAEDEPSVDSKNMEPTHHCVVYKSQLKRNGSYSEDRLVTGYSAKIILDIEGINLDINVIAVGQRNRRAKNFRIKGLVTADSDQTYIVSYRPLDDRRKSIEYAGARIDKKDPGSFFFAFRTVPAEGRNAGKETKRTEIDCQML